MNLKNRSFSLIEMIITILIISVLAGTAFVKYSQFLESQRARRLSNNLLLLHNAIEIYYAKTGHKKRTILELFEYATDCSHIFDSGGLNLENLEQCFNFLGIPVSFPEDDPDFHLNISSGCGPDISGSGVCFDLLFYSRFNHYHLYLAAPNQSAYWYKPTPTVVCCSIWNKCPRGFPQECPPLYP